MEFRQGYIKIIYICTQALHTMKEKERISMVEELMAEVPMRLDKLQAGQERVETKAGTFGNPYA